MDKIHSKTKNKQLDKDVLQKSKLSPALRRKDLETRDHLFDYASRMKTQGVDYNTAKSNMNKAYDCTQNPLLLCKNCPR